ncbi:MAG: hypothetical protein AB7G11_00150 [Phycisphaerales bacterium]
MKVTIDGKPLRIGAGENFGVVLGAARAEAGARGRMVVGVAVDGRWLPAEEIEALESSGVDAQTVSIETESPAELIQSALLDAADLLRSTDGPRESAVRHIRGGRLGDAMRDVATASAEWERARRAVDDAAGVLGVSSAALLGGSSGGEHSAGDAARLASSLASCLSEIARCVRDADWSGLSDVLEFDLAEQTSEWCERLMSAAERVGESGRRDRSAA